MPAGSRAELRAEDRVVRREVNVGRVFAVRAGFRNVVEVGVLAGAGDVRLAAGLRFLQSFLRPHACDQIIGRAIRRKKIHRHHRKLQRRSALQEQDGVVVRDACQFAAECFGFRSDGHERLAAMRVLTDADARISQRQQVFAGFFEHSFRQNGRTGRKIPDATSHRGVSFRWERVGKSRIQRFYGQVRP